jgi:hypothetical protein
MVDRGQTVETLEFMRLIGAQSDKGISLTDAFQVPPWKYSSLVVHA